MKPIFMGANGWIALNSKRDQLHDAAVRLNKKLLQDGHHYLTTNFVLDETYTGLLTKVGHFAAVDFGEKIRASHSVQIIHVSEEMEEEGWRLFKQHTDKGFSFTDCTSFVAMRILKITDAFTNDHHFEQMRFAVLLK